MTWPRLAAPAALALALAAPVSGQAAVRGKALSPALAAKSPGYKAGARLCAVDTANFRVIWDETRGSRHLTEGARGRDGRCSTVPALAVRITELVEPMRRAEVALGFQAPASDRGLARNGGNGRYDVYLAKLPAGILAKTDCTYVVRNGRPQRRWSSTTVVARLPLAVDPDRLLRETLPHEYFHAIQCRLAPRLNLLPASIVEGTANWMAAVVTDDWERAEGPFLGALAGRLLRAARWTRAVTRQGYDAWGFWYEATRAGADPRMIRTLFRRNAQRRHRTDGQAEVRAVVPGLENVLVRYALALRATMPLGGTDLPPAYSNDLADPTPMIDLGAAPSGSTTVHVQPIGYRFPGVRWDPDSGRVTIRVTGAPASAIRLIGAFAVRRPQINGAEFDVNADEAGQATVVVVNAGRTVRSVAVSASR